MLVKDNVDTRDQWTTAGSRALRSYPAKDATLITRLRAAGAVILGKANLSEWANFRAAKPTSGWSGVGGQTNNPYVLDRNPCGSSAGSAAGVAASLAQVAIGSETDGSIVCPAGMTATVGHKPSLGLVSRTGVVPISAEQDTAGPIARNVVDVALTLSALQGRDPADPATSQYPKSQPTDYAKLLRPGVLRGARIGLWRLPVLGPATDAIMTSARNSLVKAGATVVEVTPPYQARLGELEFPALLTEFHRDIDAYLATRPSRPAEPRRADRLQPRGPAGADLLRRPGAVRAGAGRAAADRPRLPRRPRRAVGPRAPVPRRNAGEVPPRRDRVADQPARVEDRLRGGGQRRDPVVDPGRGRRATRT